MANAALKVITSDEIKVEKGIPLPNPNFGKPNGAKYPFLTMEIGDSFLFPPNIKQPSAYIRAFLVRKNSQRKFATRKTAKGFRCWSVE